MLLCHLINDRFGPKFDHGQLQGGGGAGSWRSEGKKMRSSLCGLLDLLSTFCVLLLVCACFFFFSGEQLNFLMDTVASGHTFMDTDQTYHATRLVIESLTLEVTVPRGVSR